MISITTVIEYLNNVQHTSPTIYHKIFRSYQKYHHCPQKFRMIIQQLPVPTEFYEQDANFHIFYKAITYQLNPSLQVPSDFNVAKRYQKHDAYYQRTFKNPAN